MERNYLTTLEHMRFNIIVNCMVSKLRMLFDSAMTMLCRCEDTHDGNACSVDGTYKSDQEYSCPTFVLRFDSHVHQHHRVLYGVQDQHFF